MVGQNLIMQNHRSMQCCLLSAWLCALAQALHEVLLLVAAVAR